MQKDHLINNPIFTPNTHQIHFFYTEHMISHSGSSHWQKEEHPHSKDTHHSFIQEHKLSKTKSNYLYRENLSYYRVLLGIDIFWASLFKIKIHFYNN